MSKANESNPEMPNMNFLLLLASDDLDTQLLIGEIIGQIDPRWTIWKISSGRQLINILQKPPDGILPRFILIGEQMRDMSANQLLGYLSKHIQYDIILKFGLTEKRELQKTKFFLIQNLWLFPKPVKPSEFKAILIQILSIASGVSVK